VDRHAAQGAGVPDREVTLIDDHQAWPALADDDPAATCLIGADEQGLGRGLRVADHLVGENR
jgi:hypothetical protein